MLSKKNRFFFIALFITISSFSRDKFSLCEIITATTNGKTLLGAAVSVLAIKSAAPTNAYGLYSNTLLPGTSTRQSSPLSFQSITEKIVLIENNQPNFSLFNSSEVVKAALVPGPISSSIIRSPKMSINKLSLATLTKLPVVLAEVAVLKSLQLLHRI